MQGENWAFRSNTLSYIRNHQMMMDAAHPASMNNAVNTYDFDIRDLGHGSVAVRFATDRPAAPTWRSHLIRAHWLPWNNVGTTVCQIDDSADYFFTVDLSGCRVTVTPGPFRRVGTNYPTVRHIGGGLSLGDRNLATAGAVATVPLAQQGRIRSISQGSGITYNIEGFVIGYKTAWGVWHFYMQDDDPVTGNLRVRRFYP